MLEKLIENWLDSASERSYQPIFCQILMNRGYTVIHSTRHTPLEYGKDIIAIDPNGVPCAYQLKGNPRKNLTLHQYRNEVAPQLRELTNLVIANPAVPDKPHKSFLVTNGEIDELVQNSIKLENENNIRDGYPNRTVTTITRGQLLSWAKDLGISLWPSELEDSKLLLEIITSNGEDLYPVAKLQKLLSELFMLQNNNAVGKQAFFRRVSSAALLTAVSLKPFTEKENHWAIITAWTMFTFNLVAYSTKNKIQSPLVDEHISFAEKLILGALNNLLQEAIENNSLSRGDTLTDFVAYPWRKTLLISLASVYLLWDKYDDLVMPENLKLKLSSFIDTTGSELEIWGDAALIQVLIHIWAIESNSDTLEPSRIHSLLEKSMSKDLASIYYDIEDVLSHELSETLEDFISPSPERHLNSGKSSSFAYQIFLNMVYRKEKNECIKAWPSFSRIESQFFRPTTDWEFCVYRTKNGENQSYIPKETEKWLEVEKLSMGDPSKVIPNLLIEKPGLLCIWMIINPPRALSEVVNHVYGLFNSH